MKVDVNEVLATIKAELEKQGIALEKLQRSSTASPLNVTYSDGFVRGLSRAVDLVDYMKWVKSRRLKDVAAQLKIGVK